MRKNAGIVGAALLVGAVALTGCGSTTGGSPPATPSASGSSAGQPGQPAAPTEGDIAFLQGMIPHHQQAVEMSDLAARRATSEQVRALAATIKAEQGPEIRQMTAWLNDWGVAPSSSGNDMPGMDMGTGQTPVGDTAARPGPGMVSESDMARLRAAAGAEFDRLWVQLMIQHHEGAVSMAQGLLAASRNPIMRSFAEAIVTAQTAEIAQMQQMLTGP